MSVLSVGVHPHTAPTTYHAWAFDPEAPQSGPVSCSLLKRYASVGPILFRYGAPMRQTPAMGWGSLVDCLAFTPELYPREFVCKEACEHLSADGGFRSKAAKEWRALQLDAGRTIITEEEQEKALTAVERLQSTPICAELLDRATFQTALVSDTSGVPLKALLDLVPNHLDHDDCLADLKTTSLSLYSDDAIARHVGQLKYHWQAAFYLDLWNRLNPDDKRRKFKFLFQSAEAPYECRVVELDDLWLDAGRAAIRFHLPRLLADLKTNVFLSPWRDRETVLPPHNPTIYAEEAAMETFEEISA